MGPNKPTISDAEMDVLKVLWKHGPAPVRRVNEHLQQKKRRWAYNTVLTLLSRLRDKGFVTSEKQGVAHVFSPTVTQDELLQDRLIDLADEFCDGAASPLVHALVGGQRFSKEEIHQFRQLLDQLETSQPKKKKPPKKS